MNVIREHRTIRAALFVATYLLFSRSVAAAATPEELLGFSRYLPEETDGYVSLLQMDRVRSDVAASNAWRRIAAEPEIAALLAQADAALKSEDIPPPVRTAMELLFAAGESEITLAAQPDVSRNLLNVARVGLLSVGVFAPSPHLLGSPESQALERLRGPMRQQWLATVPTIQVPTFVVAARVRDAAKYRPFVFAMLDMGYQGLLANLERDRGAPPTLKPALEQAYSTVNVGETQLRRFRMKFGDVVPAEVLAQQFFGRSPLDDAQKVAASAAIADLTLDVHLGFVGDYLTIAVSSNDQLIRQIVERFEGRSTETLAASEKFAPIRAEMSGDAVVVAYADGRATHRTMTEEFLPTLNTLTGTEFLQLVGAPPAFGLVAARFRGNLDAVVSVSPLEQHAVVTLDRGVKQFARMAMVREPTPATTTPLNLPGFVPADAVGYSAYRFLRFDGLWEQLRFFHSSQNAAIIEVVRKSAVVPHPSEIDHIEEDARKRNAMMTIIDGKLAPSLQGETAIVLGSFAKISIPSDRPPAIRDLPIPTLALLIRSPNPDQTLEGLRELFDSVVDFAMFDTGDADRPPPVRLPSRSVDGLDAWVITPNEPFLEGLDVNLTRIGDAVVLSTSLELTKQMRDAQAGKAPAIAASPAHAAVEDRLPRAASQIAFFDGEAFNRELRSTAGAVFAIIDQNREQMQLSETEQQNVATAKRFVDLALSVVGCVRSGASSITAEGNVDVLRDWIRIEDLKP